MTLGKGDLRDRGPGNEILLSAIAALFCTCACPTSASRGFMGPFPGSLPSVRAETSLKLMGPDVPPHQRDAGRVGRGRDGCGGVPKGSGGTL